MSESLPGTGVPTCFDATTRFIGVPATHLNCAESSHPSGDRFLCFRLPWTALLDWRRKDGWDWVGSASRQTIGLVRRGFTVATTVINASHWSRCGQRRSRPVGFIGCGNGATAPARPSALGKRRRRRAARVSARVRLRSPPWRRVRLGRVRRWRATASELPLGPGPTIDGGSRFRRADSRSGAAMS